MTGLDVQPEHAADFARVDQFLQDLQAGMKAQVVTDLHTAIVAARFGDQHFDSTRFVGQRLFDEDVGARPQREQRFLHVAHRRRANQHQIGLETLKRFTVTPKTVPPPRPFCIVQCLSIRVAKSELLQIRETSDSWRAGGRSNHNRLPARDTLPNPPLWT